MKRLMVALVLFSAVLSADDFGDFENEYLLQEQSHIVNDPFYSFNKGVHQFNKAVYNMSVRPLAGIYTTMVPSYARKGLSNFFSNLSAPARAISLLVAGKGKDAARTFGGFIMNSIAGVGGLFEIAPHGPNSDIALAAASWGVPAGAHLELPFFGPSNLRDAAFKPVDWLLNPLSYTQSSVALPAAGMNVIDSASRSNAMINQAMDSVNSYVLVRDWYEKTRKEAIR